MFSKIPEEIPKYSGRIKPFKVSHTFILLITVDGEITEVGRYQYNDRYASLVFNGTVHFTRYKGGNFYYAMYTILRSIGFEFTESVVYDPSMVLIELGKVLLKVRGTVIWV